MGCIGLDLACSEQDVSICAKDSSGPYDYEMTSRLIELAKEKKLCYAVDIYPMYGSDVSAALRGGCDIRGSLKHGGVMSKPVNCCQTKTNKVENLLPCRNKSEK